MFEPEDTPEQKAALARLETLLALVEGWVDAVVTGASTALPRRGALRETVRRRRATGGPAEQTFATLVGLELRPRRLREAAALWEELREHRGIDGRDAVWEHPDLLPRHRRPRRPGRRSSPAPAALDLSGLEDLPALGPAGRRVTADHDPLHRRRRYAVLEAWAAPDAEQDRAARRRIVRHLATCTPTRCWRTCVPTT